MQPSEYAVGIMLIQQGKPCWQRVTRKTKGPADGVLSSLGKLLTELLWHYRKPLEWGHYLLWSYPRDGPKGEITSIIIATTTNSEQTWLSYRHGAKCFAFIISFNPHNVVSLWHGYYYDLCLLDNENWGREVAQIDQNYHTGGRWWSYIRVCLTPKLVLVSLLYIAQVLPGSS